MWILRVMRFVIVIVIVIVIVEKSTVWVIVLGREITEGHWLWWRQES